MFWHSFTLGSAVAGAWFRFYPNSLDTHIPVWLGLRYIPFFKIAAFFVPTVIVFFFLQTTNFFLIWAFGDDELSKRREEIMEKLLDSLVSNQPVAYERKDILDRQAWRSLKLFWRLK
jgi:hypothetical protein